jgi:hypothetical protein
MLRELAAAVRELTDNPLRYFGMAERRRRAALPWPRRWALPLLALLLYGAALTWALSNGRNSRLPPDPLGDLLTYGGIGLVLVGTILFSAALFDTVRGAMGLLGLAPGRHASQVLVDDGLRLTRITPADIAAGTLALLGARLWLRGLPLCFGLLLLTYARAHVADFWYRYEWRGPVVEARSTASLLVETGRTLGQVGSPVDALQVWQRFHRRSLVLAGMPLALALTLTHAALSSATLVLLFLGLGAGGRPGPASLATAAVLAVVPLLVLVGDLAGSSGKEHLAGYLLLGLGGMPVGLGLLLWLSRGSPVLRQTLALLLVLCSVGLSAWMTFAPWFSRGQLGKPAMVERAQPAVYAAVLWLNPARVIEPVPLSNTFAAQQHTPPSVPLHLLVVALSLMLDALMLLVCLRYALHMARRLARA